MEPVRREVVSVCCCLKLDLSQIWGTLFFWLVTNPLCPPQKPPVPPRTVPLLVAPVCVEGLGHSWAEGRSVG